MAGNSASTGVSNVDVDTVAPSVLVALDRAAAASSWFNISTGAPVAEFTCSDGTSGIAFCPSDFTFGEGENQSHSGTAYDVAGNSASASVSDVDVDLTTPSVSAALARSPAASGWFKASTGVAAMSTLFGASAVVAIFLWARRLTGEWPLVLAMIVLSGFMLLFFGYPEGPSRRRAELDPPRSAGARGRRRRADPDAPRRRLRGL